MTVLELIEDRIIQVISRVEGEPLTQGADPLRFQLLLPYEVEPWEYPASTLFFSYPSQTDAATGGITENQWRWVQRSYWDNSDQARAQAQMKRMLPELPAVIRHMTIEDHIINGDKFFELEIEDAGIPDPVETATGRLLLIKSLFLTATTEEI